MTSIRASLVVLAAPALLLGGCANTYLEAKQNTAAGGQQSRDIAAAKSELATAQAQNANLSDQKLQRERELDRNNKRIRAVEADLRKQDQTLASAVQAKQVSQARAAELKKEMDSVRAEMQSVDMQNKGDAFAQPDAKADAAKEARLRALEQRKKDLEAALGALTKR